MPRHVYVCIANIGIDRERLCIDCDRMLIDCDWMCIDCDVENVWMCTLLGAFIEIKETEYQTKDTSFYVLAECNAMVPFYMRYF